MLDESTIDALFPDPVEDPAQWERRYPPRDLPDGARVTRLGPSPTGFVHIGGIFAAMIDRDVAHQSGGRYIVRIEDTDQSRQVEGATEQFQRAFDYFGLSPDEGLDGGDYGPYRQSQRGDIYRAHARELVRAGAAYPCFATSEELSDIRARQQAQKVPTGYYGQWAPWRDADDAAVRAALSDGRPYVLRFRSPGTPGKRVDYTDVIRGALSAEDNYNDVVILKSPVDGVRLPTYHFAHVVDDHLMRVDLVIRGEEWLPSVPLHLQLFAALGWAPPDYAHIALLMKQAQGGKRKLSKRKDPEADVVEYVRLGYPSDAVLYYLRGLANGRLAEMPLPDALAAPIVLAECGGAGPLVDMVKLEDISADHVATMSGESILDAVTTWADEFDDELAAVLRAEPRTALAALAVERGPDVPNPRKDLRKWSDFRGAYGFFFPSLFQTVSADDERLGGLDPELVADYVGRIVRDYRHADDGQEWFGQIRSAAADAGFAPNPKEYKRDPDVYPGSIREASQVVRVALTGSTRSPDLHAVATALGPDEVLRRLGALLGKEPAGR